jgi:hypothetical protein
LGLVRTNSIPRSKGRKAVPQRLYLLQKRTSTAKSSCRAFNNGHIQFVSSSLDNVDIPVEKQAICTLPGCFRAVIIPRVVTVQYQCHSHFCSSCAVIKGPSMHTSRQRALRLPRRSNALYRRCLQRALISQCNRRPHIRLGSH